MGQVIVDERLKEELVNALATGLCRWSETKFQSGTSETKTWIALAGAMEETGLSMRLIDYVPCYRSLAGTGVGAGFAEWA